jgi:hypothetical protein
MAKKISAQRMRYQKNMTSFWFCILGLVLGVIQFIMLYTSVKQPNYRTGVDILVSIFFMLTVFWAAEKTKIYTIDWTNVLYIVSAIQVLRLLFAPLYYYNHRLMSGTQFVSQIIIIIFCAGSLIFAAMVNQQKSEILNKYLKSIGEKI